MAQVIAVTSVANEHAPLHLNASVLFVLAVARLFIYLYFFGAIYCFECHGFDHVLIM